MAINEAKLFKRIKRTVGVQDEEWDSPGIEVGFTREYAADLLDSFLTTISAVWRYSFLQKEVDSESTSEDDKIDLTSDRQYILFKKKILSIEWAQIGSNDLEIASKLRIKEEKLADGDVVYGSEEIDSNGNVAIKLLTAIAAGTSLEAIILRYPRVKYFPPEFENLFIYLVTTEMLLEKQKNNTDAARREYEAKVEKWLKDISQRWAQTSKSQIDGVRIKTMFKNVRNYRTGNRLGAR